MQARLPLEIAVEILWRGNSLAIVWPQYNKPPQSITPAILAATQARNILTRRQKGSARQNQHSLIRGRPLFWLEAVKHFCSDAIFFNLLLRLLVGLILNVVVVFGLVSNMHDVQHDNFEFAENRTSANASAAHDSSVVQCSLQCCLCRFTKPTTGTSSVMTGLCSPAHCGSGNLTLSNIQGHQAQFDLCFC